MRSAWGVALLLIAACGAAQAPGAVVVETAPVASRDAGASAPTAEIPTAPATSTPTNPSTEACDAPCKGRVGEELVTALAFRAKQSHRCYDNALATDATLRGKVMVRMRIGADGKMCSAVADAREPGMRGVADCVAAYFSGAPGAMPRPEGGCADVNLPIAFVPRGNDAGAP